VSIQEQRPDDFFLNVHAKSSAGDQYLWAKLMYKTYADGPVVEAMGWIDSFRYNDRYEVAVYPSSGRVEPKYIDGTAVDARHKAYKMFMQDKVLHQQITEAALKLVEVAEKNYEQHRAEVRRRIEQHEKEIALLRGHLTMIDTVEGVQDAL
jgi:hypothetical protein